MPLSGDLALLVSPAAIVVLLLGIAQALGDALAAAPETAGEGKLILGAVGDAYAFAFTLAKTALVAAVFAVMWRVRARGSAPVGIVGGTFV